MVFNFSEKYRYMVKRKGVKMMDIADQLGCTRQNLSRRLTADTWTQAEAVKLCDLIGCEYVPTITDKETGETL